MKVNATITINVNDNAEYPRWTGRVALFSCEEAGGTQVGESLQKSVTSTTSAADDDKGSST